MNNREFNPVFDNAPAGLFRSRFSDGTILLCNQRLAEMMGYDSTEACKRDFRAGEHYVDPDRRSELLRLLREHGEATDFEADLVRADGETISVIFNARLIGDDEPYLEGVMIDVTARQQAMTELKQHQQAVEAKNIALREVLERVEKQRQEIASSIHENVQRTIMPLIQKLRRRADSEQQAIIQQLDQELSDITAPFADQLARRYQTLTPTEVRICNLIRRGMSSKEIAAAEGITAGTVSVHREHIRRKLQLTNTKANLATFLRNMTVNDNS